MRLYYMIAQTLLLIGVPFVVMFLLGVISEIVREWIQKRMGNNDSV